MDQSPPQAAWIWGWMSSADQAKVVNRQMPAESTTAVRSWNALSMGALPSVAAGSIFTGMPSTSGETM